MIPQESGDRHTGMVAHVKTPEIQITTGVSMDITAIQAKVNELIAEELAIPVADTLPSKNLRDDFGADDMDILCLCERIENEFGILKAEMREDAINTVHDVLFELYRALGINPESLRG